MLRKQKKKTQLFICVIFKRILRKICCNPLRIESGSELNKAFLFSCFAYIYFWYLKDMLILLPRCFLNLWAHGATILIISGGAKFFLSISFYFYVPFLTDGPTHLMVSITWYSLQYISISFCFFFGSHHPLVSCLYSLDRPFNIPHFFFLGVSPARSFFLKLRLSWSQYPVIIISIITSIFPLALPVYQKPNIFFLQLLPPLTWNSLPGFPISISDFLSLGFNFFSQIHLTDPSNSYLGIPYMSPVTSCQICFLGVQPVQLYRILSQSLLNLRFNVLHLLFRFLVSLSLHLYFLSGVWGSHGECTRGSRVSILEVMGSLLWPPWDLFWTASMWGCAWVCVRAGAGRDYHITCRLCWSRSFRGHGHCLTCELNLGKWGLLTSSFFP